MSNNALPLVISAPEPRTLDLIFTPPQLARLQGELPHRRDDADGVAKLPADVLAEARYIVGQPPISPETLEQMKALRCVFNVETNLINNMPYETLFARGIHVVTTGLVFAEPVAELGLAMALNLARNIVDADLAFRQGRGAVGRRRQSDGAASVGRRCRHHRLRRSRPCAQPAAVGLPHADQGLRSLAAAVDPDRAMASSRPRSTRCCRPSDFVFVVASVTSENQGFLGADAFASMRKGAAFILLSRAGVVDFPR